MTQEKNIGFAFLAIAEKHPDLLAIVADSIAINYKHLSIITQAFASQMHQRGVGQKSVVVVDTQDVVVATVTALATALLGARWVSQNSIPVLAGVLEPTHWFQSPDMQRIEGFVQIDNSWFTTTGAANYQGFISPEAPWLYVSTSGTTGKAKLISVGQGIIYDRSLIVSDDYVTRETVFCCLFNCVAFPFLTRAFATFLNGCTLVYGNDPALWQKAGVNLVMGSPRQARALQLDRGHTPKIREIHLAGSKLTDELAIGLLDRFETVVDLYASTETNRSFKNVKSLSRDGSLVTTGQKLDSVIEIVAEDGGVCDLGVEGVIRVKNDYLVNGYVNNPEADRESFKDGWFYPGDRGRWGSNGQLEILGRTDEVINLGGVKINGAEVDRVLKGVDGISNAICFKSPLQDEPDCLIAFVVIDEEYNSKNCLNAVKAAALSKLTGAQVPQKIIEVSALPTGQKGGPLRWMCQDIYANKEKQKPK